MSSSSNNTGYGGVVGVNGHSNASSSNTINSSLYSNGSFNGGGGSSGIYYHPDFNQNNDQHTLHINETFSSSSASSHQFANFTQPIEEWSSELVAQWLAINDLTHYIEAFLSKLINGEKLLTLDSAKLKTLGVKSQKDRDFIKSKVKELRADEKRRFKFLLEQQQQNSKKKKIKT